MLLVAGVIDIVSSLLGAKLVIEMADRQERRRANLVRYDARGPTRP